MDIRIGVRYVITRQVKQRVITVDGEYKTIKLYECLGKWGTHGTTVIHFTGPPVVNKAMIAYKDEDFTNPHRVLVTNITEERVFVSLN